MSEPKKPASRRPVGRRRRRLERMAALVGGAVLTVAAIGLTIYWTTRPEVRRPGEELPEITSRLSQNLPANAPAPSFTDATKVAGLGDFRSFVGERTSQLPEDMGAGAAWGDYDNDGDDDLFVVAAGGSLTGSPSEWASSQLYRNRGDGTFEIASDFPELKIIGMGAAWGDYDNDGWLDLVVSGYNSLWLFRNLPAVTDGTRETRRFVADDSLPALPGYWAGVSWADFDNDGDLDLYVCGYVRYQEDTSSDRRGTDQYGTAVPYTLNPASFEPESNLLFRNEGNGSFSEVALAYGVSNPTGRSLSALWHDFDADGRLDLYVANDISDNALLLNLTDTFEDVSLAAWVADYRGAMGLTSGDWNRDGDDDLFVTHWVAQENALYDSRLAENLAQGRKQLTFGDLAAPLGLGQIALHSVGWGTEFGDFDSDGWLDLVVSNGSTIEAKDKSNQLEQQPLMLLWNRSGEHFHDLAPASELLSTPRLGRGLALSDYDLDGDLDILTVELDGGVRLLRNDMEGGHWVGLRLRAANADGSLGLADHATVTLTTDEIGLRRTAGSASYLSQSSRSLHIGLGANDRIDRIEVLWPGGDAEVFTGVEANAYWELRKGSGQALPVKLNQPAHSAKSSASLTDRQRVLAFWEAQRAAMDAMKRDGDIERAAGLFAQALELNPDHEDSRYYLANCLWTLGQRDGALAELNELRLRNPSSHRAHKQWGLLRIMAARSADDLSAARSALERSLAINPEETGSLLALGELAILQARFGEARAQLESVCQTNPRAVGGFFLRAFIAHREGASAESAELLRQAQAARGPEWKPVGAVAEGDVARQMHTESSPLARFWEAWDGGPDPDRAFAELASHLNQSIF